MSSMKVRLAALFCAAALAAGALLAGIQTDKTKPAGPRPRAKAERRGPAATLSFECNVEAKQRAELYPHAAGYISQMTVDIGSRVKQGDALARTHSPALKVDSLLAENSIEQAQAFFKEAEARVMTAKAEMQAAEATVAIHEAELKVAAARHARASIEAENTKELNKKKVVSDQELSLSLSNVEAAQGAIDAKKAAINHAKALVAIQKAKLKESLAALVSAQTHVKTSKFHLGTARAALELSITRAPFDGVITRRNYTAGDYAQANPVGERASLFTLVRTDIVRVAAKVPEVHASRVMPGLSAIVQLEGLPNQKFEGKVARTGYALDAKNHTLRVEIDLPNPEGKLRPGMYGSATLKFVEK